MKKPLISVINKDRVVMIDEPRYSLEEYISTNIKSIMIDGAVYDAVAKSMRDKVKTRSWFVDSITKCKQKWSRETKCEPYERRIPGTKTRAVFSLAYTMSKKGKGICLLVQSKSYVRIDVKKHNEDALYSFLLGNFRY